MEIELLINLILSLFGILVFYLIRRIEINEKLKNMSPLAFKNYMIKLGEIIFKALLLIIGTIIELIVELIRRIIAFLDSIIKVLTKETKDDYESKFGRGILLAIHKNFSRKKNDENLYKHKKEKLNNYNSVLDMIVDKKSKENEIVMLRIFIFIIISYCLSFFYIIDIQYVLFPLLTVLIWLIVIYQIVLSYRSKKGYYGRNYDEAKEIIQFIKQSSDDDINTPSGKKILNEVEENTVVPNRKKVTVMGIK